jgi:multidrug resistance efflux pump
MPESQQAETKPAAEEAPAAQEEQKKDPVKRWAFIIILLCIGLLVYHVLMDKHTPYTSDARVEAFVVPIVPLVSGPLTRVEVHNNQFVKEGQVLAVIDSAKYELAVKQAEANLQQATQASDADIAAVSAAQAKVDVARANLRNAEIKGDRIIRLAKKGAASQSRADDARSNIEASRARLNQALAELERAKSKLGAPGPDNAKVKQAMVALESARLDLHRSTVRAPSNGIITNLTVDVGQYAGTGSPIMTFIATRYIWIQANMRENCLVNIRKDDPVELVLDAAPGKIFQGQVASIGYGVSDNTGNTLGALSTVQPNQGWLRQAQYMPVLVRFSDMEQVKSYLRAGGQVNVIVYTGNHPVLNTVARLWIRLVGLLSNLY